MAFDKLIVKSLTGAAKSAFKMDLAIDSLKDRLIDSYATKIEYGITITLPFDTRAVLGGDDLPEDLLSPETINSVPPIPATERAKINANLYTLENELNAVIQQKNTLQGALSAITGPLDSLQTLSTTLATIVNTVQIGVTVIKALPVPSSVPPGVGIPLNIINGFSDALDTLSTLLGKIQGPINIIPAAITLINGLLVPLAEKFNTLDPIFDKAINIIAFIRLLLALPTDGATYQWDGTNWQSVERPNTPPQNSLFGVIGDPNGQITGEFSNQYYFDTNGTGQVEQSDIDAVVNEIASKIQQSLAVTVGPIVSTTSGGANAAANQALLDQLDENSLDPLLYRGFRLTIEFDPNNTFSFPARRVKGYNETTNVTLYSVPPDQGAGEVNTSSPYSFSTSLQVLINEVKFNIDQYWLNNPEPETADQSVDSQGTTTSNVGVVSTSLSSGTSSTSGTAGTAGTSNTNSYLPFGTPGYVTGHVRFQGGQAWRWLGGNQQKWVEHTISYEPIGRQPYNSTEETFIKTTSNPYPRAYYKWSELKQMWEFQRIQTG